MAVGSKRSFAGIAAAACLFAGMSLAYAADEPANVIKYRQNVMKAQAAHITNIAAVVKGEVSYLGNVPADARALAELVRRIPSLFPNGTDTGKTDALAKIWEEPDKFKQAAKTVAEKADALVAATASNDIATIGGALGALGKACGGCHKPYRKEEKK